MIYKVLRLDIWLPIHRVTKLLILTLRFVLNSNGMTLAIGLEEKKSFYLQMSHLAFVVKNAILQIRQLVCA